MKLCVFGGSFDPIHHGHLIVAQCAVEALGLDRLLLLPAATPPHKRGRKLAPASDRLAMVRAAVRDHRVLEASDIEIRRGGVSYTVHTLHELRRRNPRAQLFLLVGSDSLALLPKWKDVAQIARLATLVIAGRPPSLDRKMPIKSMRVRRLKTPLVEISSREIRKRVNRGRPIRYFLPEAVERHIVRRRLYHR